MHQRSCADHRPLPRERPLPGCGRAHAEALEEYLNRLRRRAQKRRRKEARRGA